MTEPAEGPDPIPPLFRNRLSWLGGGIALFGAAGILFFVAFDQVATRSNPYLGIFAWVLFPAVMGLGFATMAVGAARERKRRRAASGLSVTALPVLDLNRRSHRRWFLTGMGFVALFIPLSAVGSYHAYEVSESRSFCGETCHTSMAPEATAFTASPHASVKCVDCHVGPGAAGYVEAKASGVRRMWMAMTDTFHRPIPSPLVDLPHSRGTCLSCHTPGRFVGQKLETFAHYASDETNTPREIDLFLNVGGASPNGRAAGIHSHQAMKVEFAYLDDQVQSIPWVKVTRQDGRVTEYRTDDESVTAEAIAKARHRVMDCADCHNRIGHRFETPDSAINASFLHGRLDPSLPFLKQQAVEVISGTYATTEEAEEAIARQIKGYYSANYPEVSANKSAQVASAVSELQRVYRTNFFPSMKASWESFPSNIGHFYSPGCYRCHGGNMKSQDGRVIPKDCNNCHTVSSQREGGASERFPGADFVHPVDFGDLRDAICTDCHTGKGVPQ